MLSQFSICILPSERPFDSPLVVISALLPGVDFSNDGVAIGQAPIQTLAIENANFDLGHVEPTGMFRGIVKDGTTQKFFRRLDAEGLLETLEKVGVEVVHHQVDTVRFGIDLLKQMLDERPRSRVRYGGR